MDGKIKFHPLKTFIFVILCSFNSQVINVNSLPKNNNNNLIELQSKESFTNRRIENTKKQ